MKNKYVDFISDDHLMMCIANLYEAYIRAKSKLTKYKFYANKIDTIKLIFDSKFNDLDEKELIKGELKRQIDKSVTNAIGTFHEEVLGGIDGFERGHLSGYDIKALDGSLFADIKNKHNTMNSSASEALYQKLIRFADANKGSKCYLVQMLATSSFNKPWITSFSDREYSDNRIFKISGDQFYKLLTGDENAFFNLYKELPKAIDDFMENLGDKVSENNSVFDEILEGADISDRTIIDEITLDNYSYYLGFDKLNQ